jgi:hypothetical protein
MNSILCGKCNSEYNNDKNVPVFLPCGHTYCKKCLSDIYKKNSYIICPDDGKKLYLALDHYPVNHIIMKKITNNNAASNKKPIIPQDSIFL